VTERTCVVDGCDRKRKTRHSYCAMHEARLWKRGAVGSVEPERQFGLTPRERIAAKVQRTDSGCLIWTGYCDPDGYGRINIVGLSPAALVHRVAWTEAHGPIPAETPWVLHRCGNPPCCDIEHLFLGTHEDNMADMASKNRGSNQHRRRN
jgi:hypothetical protein